MSGMANSKVKEGFNLPEKLVFQQDLAQDLSIITKSNNMIRETLGSINFAGMPAGEWLAVRCCLPVTMHRYLQSKGLLMGVTAIDYLVSVWSAFDLVSSGNWSRPKLTKLTRDIYKVDIISCGILWLKQEFTDQSKKAMVEAGYITEGQTDSYQKLLHDKELTDIIKNSPIVITIDNPYSPGTPHSVIGWSIEGNSFVYSDVDERGGRVPFKKMPVSKLDNQVTAQGAITILL